MATRSAAGALSYFTYGAAVANGLSAVTVVVFIKSDSTGTDRGFFHSDSTSFTGNDDALSCRYDAAGASGGGTSVLKMAIQTLVRNQQLESSDSSQTTAFQSVIFQWTSGEAITLFLDGEQDTPTSVSTATSSTTTGQDSVWMHRGGKDGGNAWDGVVYELVIYNRKLTENEVRTIATRYSVAGIHDGIILHWHGEGAPGTTAGNIIDRSGNGYTGTPGGTITPSYEEDDRVTVRRRRAA